MYANTVSRYEQQTLCEFMANGYFARHIARMRLAYKRRMEAFAAALHAGLDPDLTLTGAHSGLHFLLTLPGAGGEQAMVQAAAKQGVRLKGLSEYYMKDAAHCRPDTVVAGYSGLQAGGHSRRGGRVGPGVAANVTFHHLIGTIQFRPVRGRRPLQIIYSHIINFARQYSQATAGSGDPALPGNLRRYSPAPILSTSCTVCCPFSVRASSPSGRLVKLGRAVSTTSAGTVLK